MEVLAEQLAEHKKLGRSTYTVRHNVIELKTKMGVDERGRPQGIPCNTL